MEISEQHQHYFSSEDGIEHFCDFLKWSFTSILKYDTENKLIDFSNFSDNKISLFSSAVSTYYKNLIQSTIFDSIEKFVDMLEHINEKTKNLKLIDNSFWTDIFYKVFDKFEEFVENCIRKSDKDDTQFYESMYHKADQLEQFMLNICDNKLTRNIVKNNFKCKFYDILKKSTFRWLENLKEMLKYEIYSSHNYKSTNGILNSYKKMRNTVNIVLEYNKKIEIIDLKIELNREILNFYIAYSGILLSNETFVNTNKQVLYDIYVTSLILNKDVKEFIESIICKNKMNIGDMCDTYYDLELDLQNFEKIVELTRNKIFELFDYSIKKIITNEQFEATSLINLIATIYNPNLELGLNKQIFVKVIKMLVMHIKSMILSFGVTIFKNENGIKLNSMIQQLKHCIMETINSNLMSDKTLEFITNTFGAIDLMTIYILTKPNPKNQSDESKWEDRFLERFHDKVIYNKLYQAKYKNEAVTTKIADVSVEIVEASKISGTDFVKKSAVTIGNLKTELIARTGAVVELAKDTMTLFPDDVKA